MTFNEMQKMNSMMFIKDLGNYEFYSYAFGQRNHIELLKRVYVLFSRVFQKGFISGKYTCHTDHIWARLINNRLTTSGLVKLANEFAG